mmetsp:Transcript_109403/g.185807  ORF Transcript_109403/g.185807 Transcript_109403/m.185807 type:complete len:201 (-) Transcript_109403:20-622(-)
MGRPRIQSRKTGEVAAPCALCRRASTLAAATGTPSNRAIGRFCLAMNSQFVAVVSICESNSFATPLPCSAFPNPFLPTTIRKGSTHPREQCDLSSVHAMLPRGTACLRTAPKPEAWQCTETTATGGRKEEPMEGGRRPRGAAKPQCPHCGSDNPTASDSITHLPQSTGKVLVQPPSPTGRRLLQPPSASRSDSWYETSVG